MNFIEDGRQGLIPDKKLCLNCQVQICKIPDEKPRCVLDEEIPELEAGTSVETRDIECFSAVGISLLKIKVLHYFGRAC